MKLDTTRTEALRDFLVILDWRFHRGKVWFARVITCPPK